jgi:ketosteroid isomerase-like protein
MSDRPDAPVSPDDHEADRHALRQALKEVTDAINHKNWDALDRWVDEKVIVTMIDQSTMHGRADLARYVESKLGQFSSILADLQVDPIPDAPALFHGDTAVCTLTSADRFIFRNGKEFLVQNRYTATLIKRDGDWKLVALHGGANAFNNPISYQSQNLLLGGMAAVGIGGTLLGWVLGRKS